MISVAYYALLGPDEYNQDLLATHEAAWVDINHLPPLGFDHPEMVEEALETHQEQMLARAHRLQSPSGPFSPSHSSSTLYETILGEPLDKRNFRKRVAEMDCIEKTDLIDKTGSRRGASLYCFNDNAYLSHPKFKI